MADPESATSPGVKDPENAASSQETYGDPSAKIWTVYMSEAMKYDEALVDGWLNDMDGIIIFAGLFSASVTAFIIESYAGLSPDPSQQTIVLLQQISQQLDGSPPQSQASTSDSFSPTSSTLRVNALWFLSLCLALTCALAAILVQQWGRGYLRAIKRKPVPHKQARIRAYLYEGLTKFQMPAVVEGIPTLMHASVFLFFIGLVDFLYAINLAIAWVVLSITALVGGFYLLITILPIFDRQSPFRTPLSELCWAFCRYLGLLRYRSGFRYQGLGRRWKQVQASLPQIQEIIATDRGSDARSERDIRALSWTLESLTEDKEFMPFIESIPAFCNLNSFGDGPSVMRTILANEKLQLLSRIVRLFDVCFLSDGLDKAVKRTRLLKCSNAINSLLRLLDVDNSHQYFSTYQRRLDLIQRVVKSSDPQLSRVANEIAEFMGTCAYKDVVSKFRGDRSGDISLSIKTLTGWNLSPLLEMIPCLLNYSACPRFEGHLTRDSLITVTSDFKELILAHVYAQRYQISDMLQWIAGADLRDNRPLERRASAILEAYRHIIELIWWDKSSKLDDFTKFSRVLKSLMKNRDSPDLSLSATVLAFGISVRFQRDLQLAEPEDADTRDLTVIFGSEIGIDDMLPLRSKSITPKDKQNLELLRRTTRARHIQLYETLEEEEKLRLQALSPGADGSGSLGACRGHIRLLVVLLEYLCNTGFKNGIYGSDLIFRTITNLKPYLNARWSCHRDQEHLWECIKALVDLYYGGHMNILLIEVASTIGDPSLIEEVSKTLQEWAGKDEVEQICVQLGTATSLQPLEDDEDQNAPPNGDSTAHPKAPAASSSNSELPDGGCIADPARQVENEVTEVSASDLGATIPANSRAVDTGCDTTVEQGESANQRAERDESERKGDVMAVKVPDSPVQRGT
ncbi:hypothetical protein HWV62_30821 [Athelia sp. TMB]|nr:hypothetical protein HWV62_30821 [Athelia sp. TMB]